MAQHFRGVQSKKYNTVIKSTLDRVAAVIVLIIFFPVMLIAATAIYKNMGRPIFFCQPRPGKDGRIFTFYKFRTMTNERDCDGNLLPDEQRLMPLGKFLRRTSLDELPQLLNVLKGDMSFVGPRPLLVEYLDYYTPQQARRHAVKPGITGWAQVNGRNQLSWLDKCTLDIWYVDHHSLWLDLKILVMTFLKVLKQENIGSSECPEASKQQIAAIKEAKQ
ncbi:sugar transferase [Scytonema sp. UIC 10036]|uniref:sugar transferase n=1 Tax=Scytonema sp. UIC 10036 TaxID=2304196 RepID=UPI0012DA7885|nr:sugar transferase [Scytonema sp. UIC 10036]MUG92459.1 sugar transferase [Scytonema sp. UIC 10036]